MLVYITHPELGPQITHLSADVAASASTSSVENSTGFANGDYAVFGRPDEEKTEIVAITSAANVTTIGHSTGPVFPHAARTQIAEIKYNQIQVHRATSQTGTYTLLTTVDITVDQKETVYDDTTGTTASWYKIRYKDEDATTYSDYSDPVEGVGYTEESLYDMTSEVLDDFDDPLSKEVSRKTIRKYLMAGVRKAMLQIIATFPDYHLNYTTQVLTSGTATYDLPTRFLGFQRVDVNYSSSTATDAYKVEEFEREAEGEPNTVYSKQDPRLFFRGNKFGLRPTPDNSSGYAFLWFWDYPEAMTDAIDEHGLPHGAREFLVSYALYRLWLTKEQDKALSYRTEYRENLRDFIQFVAQMRQTYTTKKIKVKFGADLYSDFD